MGCPFTLVTAAVVHLVPWGYEIDCRSWPGVAPASVTIRLIAHDGAELEVPFDIPADVTPLDIQGLLVSGLEDEDWVFRAGPDDAVHIFAPGGRTVRSIRFESDGWVPAVRRIPGPPKNPAAGRPKK
jgi:hypothetical protein